MEAGYTIKL